MEEKNIIVIEIGSSKVRGAIGTYSSSGVLTVNAVEEESMLEWVRHGVVSNVEEVAMLVNRIIRKIENRVSPRKVESVYVGIGGRSFCSVSRDVEMQFADDIEITESIINDLISEAASSTFADRELLQVIPREFYVDNKKVNRPKGTVGHKIRMSANLIVCRPSYKRNIERLFNDKLKIKVNDYLVRQISMGDVVLTSEEKRLGCMLVDFGAETTTVSIYKHGCLQYMATLPMGSRNITRDIMALNYLEEKAEKLKREVGNASPHSNHASAGFLQRGDVDFDEVNTYVSHRANEIIANIHKQLEYAGFNYEQLTGGLIVVGGGSRLAGFNDCLAQRMAMPVRIGSINVAEIRIPDSRISPTGSCDVVSVLYCAAVNDGVDCLSTPEEAPKEVVEITETVVAEKPVETHNEPEEKPKETEPARKSNWFTKLQDMVSKVMTETDDDSDFDDD
ncbi:MAG: cell division protein FtsA [Bacteroides sp.]|nr:cell division protein FtsA [Bacteroides sp.]MCM1413763.1 cell division protein FtsA [Bacteroides sp.]MCM1472218.1 cell division protein FtsA [Bacteroides sp.]